MTWRAGEWVPFLCGGWAAKMMLPRLLAAEAILHES